MPTTEVMRILQVIAYPRLPQHTDDSSTVVAQHIRQRNEPQVGSTPGLIPKLQWILGALRSVLIDRLDQAQTPDLVFVKTAAA
jgi:hypothetical protein